MKHSSKNKKPVAPPQKPPTATAGSSPRRGVILVLGLLLTAGASWAFMEFVVWNKLPSALVGKWEVVQGPAIYKEAEFEFYRSGKMVGHVNENGRVGIIYATIRVEEDKMYITTHQEKTNREHVSVQTIRTLTERELIVADEQGKIMKLVRMR